MDSKHFFPHDLLWPDLDKISLNDFPDWSRSHLQDGEPVVVRRSLNRGTLIPIGIRGDSKLQRHPCFLPSEAVTQRMTPEEALKLSQSTPLEAPQIELLKIIAHWTSFSIGVSGSFGFSLATQKVYFNERSDLDLTLRLDNEPDMTTLKELLQKFCSYKFNVDIQVQTPFGGFALKEWCRDGKVLLKTNKGPFFTTQPWSISQNE